MADVMQPFAIVGASSFLRFVIAALLIELTPGPNMGYLAIVAAQRGRRAGLLVVVGVALGLSFYLGLAVAGVAGGLLADRRIYQALRWSGIVYMVWLALEAWRGERGPRSEVSDDDLRLLGRGLVTNLLNVKAALFYAVLLPAFIDVSRGRIWMQVCLFGISHIAVATGVHVGIVMLAAKQGRTTSTPSQRLGRVYAVGLLAVAGWLAWSTRQPT